MKKVFPILSFIGAIMSYFFYFLGAWVYNDSVFEIIPRGWTDRTGLVMVVTQATALAAPHLAAGAALLLASWKHPKPDSQKKWMFTPLNSAFGPLYGLPLYFHLTWNEQL